LPGFPASYTVTAALVDQGTTPASTDVAFTVSGCPTGANCPFSPTHFTPTNSTTFFVNTPATIPAGSYPLTITATGGGSTKITTFTLVVQTLSSPFPLHDALPIFLPGFPASYTVTAALVDQGTTPASTDVAFT